MVECPLGVLVEGLAEGPKGLAELYPFIGQAPCVMHSARHAIEVEIREAGYDAGGKQNGERLAYGAFVAVVRGTAAHQLGDIVRPEAEELGEKGEYLTVGVIEL